MELTPAMKAEYSKEYSTHLNYAHCMVGMVHELKILVPVDKSVGVDLKSIRRFHKLSKLTEKSIIGEIENIKLEPDYVQVVAPWFAVKCYYRVYYLESILIHLNSGSMNVFKNSGHSYVRRTIRSYCKVGYYQTRLKHAEIVESYHKALLHKIDSGKNLKKDYYLTEECVKSVRRKLSEYSVEHWKKNSKFKYFRTKEAKSALNDFLNNSEVCLFDFYYQMRIKANYRDSDFLDFDKILSEDGIKYISLLKNATDKYCSALERQIEVMLNDRDLAL
jgi:hypothetical protein